MLERLYYLVPADFSAFNVTVENRVTRITADGSQGIVKTGAGISETPEPLQGFPVFTRLEMIDYINANPELWPVPDN